jgi:hypothetical protein
MDEPVDPLKEDFRNFLWVIFDHLGIEAPTPIQYDVAWFLQHGPDRLIVEGFRGMGKSWITAAFVLWVLYCDPTKKILVVSASKDRAGNFTLFLLRLIQEVPILQHLIPDDDQRQSTIQFDVRGSGTDQTPSVRAVGITGNMTGGRADLIVPDDVENPKNSSTEMQRQKLGELVKEFDAVLKPGGRVAYLGTPQCEMSLYNELQKRGYQVRIWPARFPDDERSSYYGPRLSPMIREMVEKNVKLVMSPTEPTRFPELELLKREASYGRSGFDLQFMLDHRMSDQHRFPLRLSDLLIMYCNPEKAPERVIWGLDPQKVWNDLPNVGLNGDRYYQPMQVQGDWLDYAGALMTIDPSGRGKDETAYTITKVLNGFVYLLDTGGVLGGATDENLKLLVSVAKKFNVQFVRIEANFGDGMFTKLIAPHFEREYPVTLEEFKTGNTQKELRIIDTVEPVLTQHRLVVDAEAIKRDFESTQDRDEETAHTYSLFYQLTRVTRERGALIHDDRLDALQMALAYWMEHFERDVEKQMANRQEELQRQLVEDFIRSAGKGGFKAQKPQWVRRA